MADEQFSVDGSDLVRCEVTGKMVPPEDTVMFQGRRVCAEGKERLLDMLKSGERLPGEMDPPSVGRRWWAMFADGLVLMPILIILYVLVLPDFSQERLEEYTLLNGAMGLVVVIISITYYTLMHGYRGKTVGKMISKIKVVNSDGTDIDIRTAFIRAIVYAGPFAIPSFVMILHSQGVLDIFGYGMLIQQVANLYFFVSVIVALIDKGRQRAIHDFVAKTRVIIAD